MDVTVEPSVLKTKSPLSNIVLLGGIMGRWAAASGTGNLVQMQDVGYWIVFRLTVTWSMSTENLCQKYKSYVLNPALWHSLPWENELWHLKKWGGWRIDGGLVTLAASFLFSLHWIQSTGKTFSLTGHFLEKATRPALNYKTEKQYDAD